MMAKRKVKWQVVRNDSTMRSLRSIVATFDNLKEAREFVKAGGEPGVEWFITTKPDVRSKKEKADAGDF